MYRIRSSISIRSAEAEREIGGRGEELSWRTLFKNSLGELSWTTLLKNPLGELS